MLRGKRVLLRAIERDDLPRLVEFANDLEVYAFSGYHAWRPGTLPSREIEFDRKIEQQSDDALFAIEVDGSS